MILLHVFSIDAHLSLPAFIAWLSSSSLFPDLCVRLAMVTFFLLYPSPSPPHPPHACHCLLTPPSCIFANCDHMFLGSFYETICL